jgi:hypothetical protein
LTCVFNSHRGKEVCIILSNPLRLAFRYWLARIFFEKFLPFRNTVHRSPLCGTSRVGRQQALKPSILFYLSDQGPPFSRETVNADTVEFR